MSDVDLGYIIYHWSDAYDINMRRGRYEARRRDDGTMLTADSAEDLLNEIRADYAAHPVPRRIEGADRPQAPDCRFRPEG